MSLLSLMQFLTRHEKSFPSVGKPIPRGATSPVKQTSLHCFRYMPYASHTTHSFFSTTLIFHNFFFTSKFVVLGGEWSTVVRANSMWNKKKDDQTTHINKSIENSSLSVSVPHPLYSSLNFQLISHSQVLEKAIQPISTHHHPIPQSLIPWPFKSPWTRFPIFSHLLNLHESFPAHRTGYI